MKLLQFFFLVACVVAALPAHADVIHLTNGDRISGEILEDGDAGVRVRTDFGAELAISKSFVASVEGAADPETETETEAVEEMVAAVVEAPAPVPRAWKSNIGLNSSFSRGNTDSDLINLQADYSFERDRHRYSVDLSSIRETKEGDKVKEQDRLNLGYNYLFSDRWFFALNSTIEHDPVALLDHRISINPGVGYDIWNEESRKLNVQMGAGYSDERSDGVDESSSQIDWRLNYTQKILDGAMNVFHKHQVYKNMQGRKNLVFNSQTGVRYDLSDQLFLNIQLNYDYDDEPSAGTDSKDLTFLVGAGMSL